jgi:hypothetical protein
MMNSITHTALALAALGAAWCAHAGSLAVYPPDAQLENVRDLQGIAAVWTREDGVTMDVTATAQVAFTSEGVARWIPETGQLAPVADGETTVNFTYEGQTVEVPVKVSNAAADPAISFRNDVLPVLFRAGCNGGACHGSARGKNGFGLTLFGYGPDQDFINLTRDNRGRRMDVANPEESLMLTKPTGEVAHEGGAVMEKDSDNYNTIKRWIAEGAQNDPAEVKNLADIEILPKQVVLEAGGIGDAATQRFIVRAKFTDGSDQDVTRLAILGSSDDATLKIDGNGFATSGSRGEVYIMARFGSFAVVSQAIVIPGGQQLDWPEDAQPHNYVDEYVFAKLKKLRVAPAALCDDSDFLRRAYLDIAGTLPTIEEAEAFYADEDPDKRDKLVDQLIERPEFSDIWTMKWAEVLRVKAVPNVLDPKGMNRYNDWLREKISRNVPMDQIVRELLASQGGNFTNPATNFYIIERDPSIIAENVAQVFMGVQMKCAQCHNHPFERWTMDDYYSFAAFFGQVGRKASTDPREQIIYNAGGGEVKHLITQAAMAPKFLGGERPDTTGKDRRQVLAEWLTSPENPWFSKNIANRVWQHFLGAGIVDPPDDVRVTNPPANPDLLEVIGRKMVEYNYDLRSLVRDICKSYTYQMSTQPRAPEYADTRNFAVARLRRLSAEQMLQALSVATDTDVKFSGLPLGATPTQIAGASSNYFLNIFGRPARDSVCTCDRTGEPTLAQSLHLINGSTVNGALAKEDSSLNKWIAEELPPADIVKRMYLASVSRPPTEDETARLTAYVEAAEDKKAALQDAFWSVLNSKEFIFNH